MKRGLLVLLLLWQAAAGAEELRGTAIKIFDGDSFILRLESGKDVDVRLGEIDAPEKDQPYAEQARAALAALIFKQKLKAVVIDVDPYRRKVARVYRLEDALDINTEMVKRGHAWVYRRWVRDRTLFEAERTAKEAKRGLWALPDAQRIPPWKWRREHPKGGSAHPAAAGVHSPAVSEDIPQDEVRDLHDFPTTNGSRAPAASAQR